MIFSVGTKVRLRHTGDEGTILAALADGMLKVKLDDGFEIPVHENDLESMVILSKMPPKKDRPKTAPPIVKTLPRTQYAILKSKGIQVAFEPIYDNNGQVKKFLVFLINDTRFDFIFEFELSFIGATSILVDDLLKGTTCIQLGEMPFDQLNSSPQIDITGQQLSTAGAGAKLSKTLKIKAKTFFSKIVTAPLINRPVHLFVLFGDFEEEENEKPEDLKSYTKRNATIKPQKKQTEKIVELHDVEAVAEFPLELDLHIESLVQGNVRMNKGDILRTQLWHFDNYVDRAYHLGIERVFIIHGVGEGKLKDAVARRLAEMPHRLKYKNEFHPKYGWGATEVVFK